MKILALTTLSAAALALSACGHKSDTTADTRTDTAVVETADNMSTRAPAPTGGQAFADAAAASDTFEIETSKLALTKSSSSAVKGYAQKMIDAHTDSTAKLNAAASSASPAISPAAALSAEQQDTLASLRSATGGSFDKAYIAAQTEGHQKTLDMLRAYAGTGDVAQLKAFATTLTPIVAAHLNMARSLKA